jgi:hypothetical protein
VTSLIHIYIYIYILKHLEAAYKRLTMLADQGFISLRNMIQDKNKLESISDLFAQ